MSTYQAPLKDMRFVLNELAGLSEVAKLQRERGLGLSAAVNELARAGFRTARQEYHYEHVSHDMGALVDLSDVADVLDLLDEAGRPTGSAHAS